MRKIFAYALLSTILVALTVHADDAPSEKGEWMKALNVVLLVKEAEQSTYAKSGRYVPYANLVKSGALAESAKGSLSQTYKSLSLQNEKMPFDGYRFAMLISSDGAAYKISLEQDKKCGIAFFSSDTGTVFFGKALGCPLE